MDIKYILAVNELQYYDPDQNKHICKICYLTFKLVGRAYKHIENKHWQEVTNLSNSDYIKEIIE